MVDQYFTEIFEICDQSTIPTHVLTIEVPQDSKKNVGSLIYLYLLYLLGKKMVTCELTKKNLRIAKLILFMTPRIKILM